ncbi:MAG: hypothetical protein HRU32_12500 [Rhodobacteraceae bacterium]|nr:hypothetical protein [Paracoccaceae bacterium]
MEENGRFSSNNVEVFAYIGGLPFTLVGPSSLQGDFHESGAQSMSGVIYGGNTLPELKGGFLAARDP